MSLLKEKRNASEMDRLRLSLIGLYSKASVFLVPSLVVYFIVDYCFKLNLTVFQKIGLGIALIILSLVFILRKKRGLKKFIIYIHTFLIVSITINFFLWFLISPSLEQMLILLLTILIVGLIIIRLRLTILYFFCTTIGFVVIYINQPDLSIKFFFNYLLCAVTIIAFNYWREVLYSKAFQAQKTYKSIFSGSQDLIFVLNHKLKILETNETAESYLKSFVNTSVIGDLFSDVFCTEKKKDLESFQNAIKEVLNEDGIEIFEASCSCLEDKEYVPKEFTIRKSRYFGEEVLIVSIRIIKELKQKEQKLIESREKITQVFENINSFVFNISYDINGISLVNYVSPKVKEIYGIEVDEYITRVKSNRVSELFHPDDRKKADEAFTEIINKIEIGINKLRIIKDGEVRWLEEKIYPKKIAESTAISLFGIVTDVTEREESLIKIRESEHTYRQLFERNLAGVYKTHVQEGIIDCNLAFANILGYDSVEEIKSVPILDIYYVQGERDEYIRKLRKERHLNNFITILKKKDGRRLSINNNVSIFPDENGELNIIEGTLIDVTELQETSNALKQSEEKYRLLFEESHHAILLITFGDTENVIIDSNEYGCQLFETNESELIGQNLQELVDEKGEGFSISKKDLKQDKIEKEILFKRKNGEKFESEVSISNLSLGEENIAQVIIKDVSNRKRNERELEKSRTGFKNIVDNSPQAILIFTEGVLVYTNPQGKIVYDDYLNTSSKNLSSVFPKEHTFLIKDLIVDAKNHLNSYTEIEIGPEEHKKTFSLNVVNTDYNHRESQLFMLRDTTLQNEYLNEKNRAELAEETNLSLQEEIERHKATQQRLLENSSRLDALFHGSSELLIATINEELEVQDFNKNFENFVSKNLGTTLETQKKFFELFETSETGKKSFEKKFEQVFQGETHEVTSYFPDNKGRIIWVESFVNPIVIEGEKIKEISIISHDITDKKETQEAIKISEANNRAILLAMPDTLLKVNKKGIITDVSLNSEGKVIFHRISNQTELKGASIKDIIESEEITKEIVDHIDKALKTSEVLKHTFVVDNNEDHNQIYLENRYSKTNDEEVIILVRNVTDTMEFEENLKDSVKEKEVLLKEVHHRVKNNLQVINSILNLQSSYVEDEKTLEIINESQNRIRSMSYIHETLYQTTDFSSLNFADYVTNLVKNLVHSYQPYENKTTLTTEIEKVDLALDQAIPCGLILNELVSNALKYAYPNVENGEIIIRIKEEEGKIYLSVEDFGPGLDEEFKIEDTASLGLSLVHSLVDQLDGELILKTDSGTNFLIIFEKQELN